MSGTTKKATDEQIEVAYAEYRSVWKVAKKFGMCGQSVHERLVKMAKIVPMNVFTEADEKVLLREYQIHRDAGKLVLLATRLGRTKQFVCRQAKRLGLTDPKGPKCWKNVWKDMPIELAEGLFEKFKQAGMGLGQFCKHMGYDDLGFSRTMKAYFPDEWEHVIELKAPKQSMYRLGRSLEYRVRDQMKERGYYAVRTPASKSPVDITAFKSGVLLMIQCKRSGALRTTEWNALLELAVSVGAVPVVAMSEYRKTLYKRIIGSKDGSKRAQPWEDFEP